MLIRENHEHLYPRNIPAYGIPNTQRLSNCGKAFQIDHAYNDLSHAWIPNHTPKRDQRHNGSPAHRSVLKRGHRTPPSTPIWRNSLPGLSKCKRWCKIGHIRAIGFWTARQDTFFDVRVFHSNAPSNRWRRKEKSVRPESQRNRTRHLHPVGNVNLRRHGN